MVAVESSPIVVVGEVDTTLALSGQDGIGWGFVGARYSSAQEANLGWAGVALANSWAGSATTAVSGL